MAIDITNSELGEELHALTLKTCKELHDMTYNELMVRRQGKATNLQNYMLNESMILLQFIEGVLSVHKQMMAQGYSRTAKRLDGEDLK